MKSQIMAILGLMSVMLVGTAYAEEIHYTGDDMPLNIDVYQGDVLHFVGTDKIPNLWTGIPTNCENIVAEGKCFIEFTERYTVGTWNWESKSGVSGKFQVFAPVDPADDTSYFESSSKDRKNASQQAKDFKAKIEAKLDATLLPYKQEIGQLWKIIATAEKKEALMQNQIAEYEAELEILRVDSQKAKTQIETIEKYKKDASDWRAVAIEQLKVMAEVLGLF